MAGDGPHQLLLEETARGLGLTKSRGIPSNVLTSNLLQNLTSIFHWEYISQCLFQVMNASLHTVSDSIPVPTADGNVMPDTPSCDAWTEW